MKHSVYTTIDFRTRAWRLVACILLLFLAARLWTIQIANHDSYRAEADQRQGRCWPIKAPRGNICDRHGNPLALNLKLFSIAADPALVSEPAAVATQLSPVLRMPTDQLEARLSPDGGSRYIRLREGVDAAAAEAVRELACHGLIVDTEWRRAYPHRHLAASVLGFVGRDRRGLSGIEAALDKWLAGEDGEVLVVLDGRRPRSRAQIPGRSVVTKRMTPGSSVEVTLDLDIQAIAEEELTEAVELAQASGGTVVVMDPANGNVLALATYPTFDPNEFGRYPRETWVSQAVVSPYEPGSTFKLITACAAIEEGVMADGETYTCAGSRSIGRRNVHCPLHAGRRDHGELDLDQMVVQSCNTGMATVALELGADRMDAWARRFGFGQPTGIELPGESRGILPPSRKWSQMRVANVGFGQGISVTPLQLLAAYCAVANGGYLVHPHVVQAIIDPTGRADEVAPSKPTRVISSATAARLRHALELAVREGTGKNAQIAGRRVAGKTGTAQKPVPGLGFSAGKYVASFAGFAPAEHARLAVLVVVDEPQGSHYGGVVAAPAFREICERALTVLRVPPDAPASPRRLTVARAGHAS